jgi:TusA-related sulfurtransferase
LLDVHARGMLRFMIRKYFDIVGLGCPVGSTNSNIRSMGHVQFLYIYIYRGIFVFVVLLDVHARGMLYFMIRKYFDIVGLGCPVGSTNSNIRSMGHVQFLSL